MASNHGSPVDEPGNTTAHGHVGSGVVVLGEDHYIKASTATPMVAVNPAYTSPADHPSYFTATPGTNKPANTPEVTTPASPAQAAQNASSGLDLLRRLSLKEPPSQLQTDSREQYPGLRLTGRVISAAFCIPYKVCFRPGNDWVCCSLYLFSI